ncbi:unnamed protein product [Linum tenue]|uniref:Uncharacterized protein n=1 Tax=Linum tenue TaxID=586396 RepID=A0AAV0QDD1_9ROSI|nr:unnamed protein product [Linum tenue]
MTSRAWIRLFELRTGFWNCSGKVLEHDATVVVGGGVLFISQKHKLFGHFLAFQETKPLSSAFSGSFAISKRNLFLVPFFSSKFEVSVVNLLSGLRYTCEC